MIINPSVDIKCNLLVDLTIGLGRCKEICNTLDPDDSKAELDDYVVNARKKKHSSH